MRTKLFVASLALASLASCAPVGAAPGPMTVTPTPLDSLPGGADLQLVRQDLLATAADRAGVAHLAEARAAPTRLIAKRFLGMVPPPPPGQLSSVPTPAAALLVRRSEGWMVGTAAGWRPADPVAARDIDAIIANAAFWAEAAYTPPCPDFGANLLLLKTPGKPETVRQSTCMSHASRLVEAALRA